MPCLQKSFKLTTPFSSLVPKLAPLSTSRSTRQRLTCAHQDAVAKPSLAKIVHWWLPFRPSDRSNIRPSSNHATVTTLEDKPVAAMGKARSLSKSFFRHPPCLKIFTVITPSGKRITHSWVIPFDGLTTRMFITLGLKSHATPRSSSLLSLSKKVAMSSPPLEVYASKSRFLGIGIFIFSTPFSLSCGAPSSHSPPSCTGGGS